jgi:hypothetical protein
LKRTDFLQDAVFLAMQGIDILAENRRALLLRAIIWRRRKTQGIARPVPSALHLDFFAAAKPLLLGTARGEVTLLLSLDKREFCAI